MMDFVLKMMGLGTECDGVTCWANDNDVLLLWYALPSGNTWWYLADLHDLETGRGDFYRTSQSPPTTDWGIQGCQAGVEPVPTVTVTAPPREPAVRWGAVGGGTGAASRHPTASAGEAWAAQQAAAIHCRSWQGCVEVSAGPRVPLPEPLKHAMAEGAEAAEAPWYLMINGAELHRSWQPESERIGALERREVVQVLELVTGSRHFPTAIGTLDLRAMARCEKGWFQCRNQQGAAAVRPAEAPAHVECCTECRDHCQHRLS